LVEETDKTVKFFYSNEKFNFIFILDLIDEEYVKNLKPTTIELNNIIKETYKSNISSRLHALYEKDYDDWY